MAYTKLTDFAVKDSLLTGNPAKIVKGSEIDAEFTSIESNDAQNLKPSSIVAATSKATPVDADLIPIVDSAASNILKKLSWANLKATLKTWIEGTSFASLSTGALSATGKFNCLSSSKWYAAEGGASRYFTSADDGTGQGIYANATAAGFLVSSSAIASATSTGLAVTGALSATGESSSAYMKVSGGSGAATSAGLLDFSSGYTRIISAGASAGVYGGLRVYRANAGIADVQVSLDLDTAGNLGLGVTPSAWGSSFKVIQAGSGAAFAGSNLTSQSLVLANAYSDAGGLKYINTAQASYYQQYLGAHAWFTAPSGTAGNAISFGDPKMKLDASGDLLLNDTNTGFSDTNSVVVRSNLGQAYFKHLTGTGSGTHYSAFSYAGAAIGSITQNGTTAVAYNTTSDHRLKENVRPADAARFMDIEFVDFEWTDGRHDCGVIADQLQAVYPDLVLGAKDATEVRTVEITPAVPAVTERRLVTPAIPAVVAVEARAAVPASPAEYTTVTTDEVVLIDGVETTITRTKLVETKPAVEAQPAVEAVAAVEAVDAVYEDVVVTPAVPAVTEEQTFPVYQQVNYIGLIGRIGTTVQKQQRLIEALEARLAALEANV